LWTKQRQDERVHVVHADSQAEALANTPPLPGVPLQVRNAPTALMKKLGYGKEYSYQPDFAHPVYNVSGLIRLWCMTSYVVSLEREVRVIEANEARRATSDDTD
jgi:putative ATPase